MKPERLTVERQIVWIGALVLALFAVMQGLWFVTARASREADEQVQHTLDVQNELERLVSALQNVEAGYRGFVITGETPFLDPGRAGAAEARERLGRLLELTNADEAQLQRVRELEPLIARKLQFNEDVLAAHRAGGLETARELIAAGEGRRIMNVIHAVVDQMRAEEATRLTVQREAAAARSRNLAYLAAFAGVLLAATVVVFLVVARRDLARRAVVTDALRRNERTLRRAAERLERSNRDLQDFAMIASHDLQEPLRKILMFGDRLREEARGALSDEALDYVRRMQIAAGRGQTLIEGLLTYSRVATKAQPAVPVSLTRIAREVVDDLEASLAAVAGEVRVGDLPTIEGDPLQMRQLFQNLIGNALKFHRSGVPPRVELNARAIDGDGPELWEISVADNGIGFDEKYLDRIFKLFQRLHERSSYDGAGMGLAICRRIVERHGGAITARSAPGSGATFLISIPARQPVTETAA